jgi:hypothetical protein
MEEHAEERNENKTVAGRVIVFESGGFPLALTYIYIYRCSRVAYFRWRSLYV